VCFGLGDENITMTVHHICPQFIKLDNSKKNLVDLCRDCHNQIETVYAGGFKTIPKYKEKRDAEADKNRMISRLEYYQELVNKKDEDRLQEMYKRFILDGNKLYQFNPQGFKQFIDEKQVVLDRVMEDLREELKDFSWQEYYKACREIVLMTARFRKVEKCE
jgi:hypothetical protein